MSEAIIVPDANSRTADRQPIAATGRSFDVHEWSGGGPGYLHVHYEDDEAWHVLEGTLTPRLRDLIAALEEGPRDQHNEIMRKFNSEILE